MTHHDLDRQIQNLHDLGYPALAGMTGHDFDALVGPLRQQVAAVEAGGPATAGHDLAGLDPDVAAENTRIPFLLVVRSSLVATVDAVARWSVKGKAGWTDMGEELSDYASIEGVNVPEAAVYLLFDIDTGPDTLGVCPDDALPKIRAAGRTPLSIDEGVALLTQFPDVFTTHNAFQALGSRAQNKRVPSFWMSKGAPRLGWCWAGNPHTWLGAASAGGRGGGSTT